MLDRIPRELLGYICAFLAYTDIISLSKVVPEHAHWSWFRRAIISLPTPYVWAKIDTRLWKYINPLMFELYALHRNVGRVFHRGMIERGLEKHIGVKISLKMLFYSQPDEWGSYFIFARDQFGEDYTFDVTYVTDDTSFLKFLNFTRIAYRKNIEHGRILHIEIDHRVNTNLSLLLSLESLHEIEYLSYGSSTIYQDEEHLEKCNDIGVHYENRVKLISSVLYDGDDDSELDSDSGSDYGYNPWGDLGSDNEDTHDVQRGRVLEYHSDDDEDNSGWRIEDIH